MKVARITLGFLCIIAAAIPPYLLYATSENGNLRNPLLFFMMLVASVTSFIVFSLAKRIPSFNSQLIAGIGGSYIALFCLIFLASTIEGTAAELFMWSPIIVLFGIPFMAPLVALSWLGSSLIFGIKGKCPVSPQNTNGEIR